MKRLLIIFLLCSILVQLIHSEKILFLTPLGTKSHKNVFDPLIEALAEKGHQVSVIVPSKSSKLHANVKEVAPPAAAAILNIIPEPFKVRRAGRMSMIPDMDLIVNICNEIFQDKDFQEMTNQSYDLVIMNAFLNNCFDGLLYKINAPFILVTSMPAPSFITEYTGNYLPLSFVPAPYLDLSENMTFRERFLNTAVDLLSKLMNYAYFNRKAQTVYKQHLGQDYPDTTEILRNVSVVLMNSYFSLTFPRPNLPDNVEVGGMHCRPAKPLPKDLDEFLTGAEHGFVYFSLGSIIQAKNMPEETRKTFVTAFSKLKQRVIWKWEANMTDLPPNVMINKWLPQQDILGHPNIRAFVTHGGLLSTQEAVYHGVPLLGLPVFADQDLNMKQATNQGYALNLEILDLDSKDLEDKLNRILNEPHFYERAKYLSSIFRDQMQTPVERAVFWAEYVMRHKGAHHLRSAARHLNYFQVKSMDVIGFLALLTVFILSTLTYCCKFAIRKCCRMSGRSIERSKKKLN